MLTGDIKMQKYLRMIFDSVRTSIPTTWPAAWSWPLSPPTKDIFEYVFGERRPLQIQLLIQIRGPEGTTWYKAIAGSRETTWFSRYMRQLHCHSSISDNFITVGQPVMDKASGMVNGIVAADIKEDVITQKSSTVSATGSSASLTIRRKHPVPLNAQRRQRLTILLTFPQPGIIFWNPQALPWKIHGSA